MQGEKEWEERIRLVEEVFAERIRKLEEAYELRLREVEERWEARWAQVKLHVQVCGVYLTLPGNLDQLDYLEHY